MNDRTVRRRKLAVGWTMALLAVIWLVAFALPGQLYEVIAAALTVGWALAVVYLSRRR